MNTSPSSMLSNVSPLATLTVDDLPRKQQDEEHT